MIITTAAHRVLTVLAANLSGCLTRGLGMEFRLLGPFEAAVGGTAVELGIRRQERLLLAILLCEVPTGVIADTYSRRLSVIIGVLIMGGAFVLEGLAPLVAAVLLAEVIAGVGETFLSGATDA